MDLKQFFPQKFHLMENFKIRTKQMSKLQNFHFLHSSTQKQSRSLPPLLVPVNSFKELVTGAFLLFLPPYNLNFLSNPVLKLLVLLSTIFLLSQAIPVSGNTMFFCLEEEATQKANQIKGGLDLENYQALWKVTMLFP